MQQVLSKVGKGREKKIKKETTVFPLFPPQKSNIHSITVILVFPHLGFFVFVFVFGGTMPAACRNSRARGRTRAIALMGTTAMTTLDP